MGTERRHPAVWTKERAEAYRVRRMAELRAVWGQRRRGEELLYNWVNTLSEADREAVWLHLEAIREGVDY